MYVIMYVISLLLLAVLSYLWLGADRRGPRPAPASVKLVELVKFDLAKFDLAKAEAELERPLADVIAEAERKAIAMHNPIPGTTGTPYYWIGQVKLHSPPVQHPFDPCQYANCPKARSEHEHVQIIPTGNTVIETTAFGDRERSYIDAAPYSVQLQAAGGSYIKGKRQALQDRRRWVYEQIRYLAAVDATRGRRPYTAAEMAEWDMLYAELNELNRRIDTLMKAS